MISYVAYEDSGTIISFGTSQKGIIATIMNNLWPLNFLELPSLPLRPMDYYINSEGILKRPVMSVYAEDGSYLIPVGTEVYLDDVLVGVCETGELEIEKPDPLASYYLKLVNFPYLDYEATL